MVDPIVEQETRYRLPYHWFPRRRLKRYEFEELQRIIFDLISVHSLKPIRRYLDVGCGDGKWCSEIHNYLGSLTQTVGIDFSSRAIGFAKLIAPEINFQVHRAENIPFESHTFDLVTAIEVIEHVEEEAQNRFLQEISRVLTEDGLFLLTTPSRKLKLPPHHFRHYSMERLNELFLENGYTVIDLRGQSVPCYGFKRVVRSYMNRLPFLWKLWKFSYSEAKPEKALTLIVVARPNRT